MSKVSSILQALNNDGNMRFVFYLSQGNGYFKPIRTDYNTKFESTALFQTDINGDGQSDMFQAWNNNGIMSFISFLAKGDGSFSPIATSYEGYPTGRLGIFPMDIDGNGKSDILQAWDNNGKVAFVSYLSQGDGTFKAVPSGYSQSSSFIKIWSMDIDGDGKSDVLQIWNNNGKVAFTSYLSKGDGSFSVVNSYYTVYPDLPTTPYNYIDINGDGKSDVLQITNLVDKLVGFTSYLSQGDGTFKEVYNVYPWDGNNAYGDTIIPMDILNNGKFGILHTWCPNSSGSEILYSSYSSQGDGSFNTTLNNIAYGDNEVYCNFMPEWYGGPIDINGDGQSDFVRPDQAAGNVMRLNSYLSQGNGSFTVVQDASSPYPYSYQNLFPMDTDLPNLEI